MGYLVGENFSPSSEPAQTSFPTCAALLWSSCTFWFDVSDTDPVVGTVMAHCSCQLGYITNHLKPSLFLARSSVLSVLLALDPSSPGLQHRLKTSRSPGILCRLFMGTGQWPDSQAICHDTVIVGLRQHPISHGLRNSIYGFFSIVAYNINLILTFPDVWGGSKPSNVLLMLISLLEIWGPIIQHCKSTDYDLLPAILAWLPIVVIIACFSWLNVILLEPFQNYFILIFGNGNIIYDLWRTASTDLLRILPRSPSHLTSLNLHKYSSKFQEVFKHHAE